MSKTYMELLKSRDAQERKRGINAAAKALDRKALHQLAVMIKDDPDPELRQLAQQAGRYIRTKLGDIPATAPPAPKEGEEGEIVVKENDIKSAQRLMDSAVGYNIANDAGKAMKSLQKALKLNPNLIKNDFFISVAESVTGLTKNAALEQVKDESSGKSYSDRERARVRQDIADLHMKEVNKSSWGGVIFDGLMMFFVLSVAYFFGFLVVNQNALAYEAKVFTSQTDYANSYRTDVSEDGKRVYYMPGVVDGANKPMAIPLMEMDDFYVRTVAQYASLTLDTLFIRGLTTGGIFLAAAVGGGLLMNILAKIFGGVGTSAHGIQQIIPVMVSRLAVGGVLMAIGGLITYEVIGPPGLMIIAGGVGLVTLIAILGIILSAAKSYNFSFIPGLLSSLPVIAITGGGAFFVISHFL